MALTKKMYLMWVDTWRLITDPLNNACVCTNTSAAHQIYASLFFSVFYVCVCMHLFVLFLYICLTPSTPHPVCVTSIDWLVSGFMSRYVHAVSYIYYTVSVVGNWCKIRIVKGETEIVCSHDWLEQTDFIQPADCAWLPALIRHLHVFTGKTMRKSSTPYFTKRYPQKSPIWFPLQELTNTHLIPIQSRRGAAVCRL